MRHRSNQGAMAFFVIKLPSENVSNHTVAPITTMDELFNIINDGKAHVKVEMDAEDLMTFSNTLIQRAKDELGSMVAEAQKERMLTKSEVKSIFGVCDTTLWNWQNKGILTPVKTGNKILYHESEVRKALGMRNIKL